MARSYRKLHLAINTAGKALALTLTDQHVDDPSQLGALLNQTPTPISGVWANVPLSKPQWGDTKPWLVPGYEHENLSRNKPKCPLECWF